MIKSRIVKPTQSPICDLWHRLRVGALGAVLIVAAFAVLSCLI
ncbi:hypothetical protein OE699_02060 [Sedimentimonas flavescens]|uniref:Uncharacterized protein n=1 Tax=Sedimentimonas flavescens TaxID=2851012 RepID=A0ABT2ZV55_9RHOB|nr:hypothetical protein [Sedimentimonas flavescens]MCV2877624.1 hypothetical protein [Sedimentimonas flavescens]